MATKQHSNGYKRCHSKRKQSVSMDICKRFSVISLGLLFAVIQGSAAIRIGDIPQFTQEPEPGVAETHRPHTLHCRTRPPATQTRWKLNGRYLDPPIDTAAQNGGVEIRKNGDLHIASFRHKTKSPSSSPLSSHVGVYQCVATTELGTLVSREVTLERAVIHNFSPKRNVEVSATEGNVALLPCTPPGGYPHGNTVFEVNGTTIENNGRYRILPSGNLQIDRVRQSDQGSYRCVSVNPVTDTRKAAPYTINLRVIVPVSNSPARIVLAPPENAEVLLGETLTLECVIVGSPLPRVVWDKYGGSLPVDRFTQELGNLVIKNVTRQDQGTYICRVEGGRRAVAAVSFVEVLQPPRIRTPRQVEVVTEGSRVAFQCLMRGNPQPKGEWLHNGQSVFRNEYISISDTSLTISNVLPEHGGLYQCVARSKVGMAHAELYLDVRKPGEDLEQETDQNEMQDIAPDSVLRDPTFEVVPSNMSVHVGSTTLLECSVTNPENTQIHWLKDSKPFAYSSDANEDEAGAGQSEEYDADEYTNPEGRNRHKVTPNGALQIFNAMLSDSGTYSCIATNPTGEAKVHAFLRVTDVESPSLEPEDESKSSPLPVDLVFTTNPTMLPNNGTNPRDVLDPFLTDEDGDFEDFGNSRERGRGRNNRRRKNKNRGGGTGGGGGGGHREEVDQYDAGEEDEEEDLDYPETISVDGSRLIPPSRPMVEKLSDTSVKISWTVAAGGLPITFFKVQYKDLTTTDRRRKGWRTIDEDIAEHVRRYEVPGLRSGGTFRFRVVAVYTNNDNKQSPNSARFKLEVAPALRPLIPSNRPVIVTAKPLSAGAIKIQWHYQPQDQSPIEGFFIYYKPWEAPVPFQKETLVGADFRLHIIQALRPNTQYSIKITSFNSAGESEDSNIVTKKTLALSELDLMGIGDTNIHQQIPENPPPHTEGGTHNPPDKNSGDKDDYPGARLSTKSSSEMLYMILGIVLGVMMLMLIIFMVMCGWKQRQQRRMMAALHANMRKFDDPAKVIHNDSLRKKHLINGSPFVLNGLTIPNGHANGVAHMGNGHAGVHYQNGGSRVNLNINPMSDLEQRGLIAPNEDINDQSLNDLRTSLQGVLPPPPNIPPPACPVEQYTLDRQSQYSNMSDARQQNLNPCDTSCCNDNVYNSLRRHPDRAPAGGGGFEAPPAYRDYLHGRPFEPKLHDQSDSSSGRRKKQRRRHREPSGGSGSAGGPVRDQSTNTDLSSNEGTLDDRSMRRNRYHRAPGVTGAGTHPRETSRSPTSPPPGYSRTDNGTLPNGYGPYDEVDELYANTSGANYSDQQEPPRVPSPPVSYGVAHSYGPTANSSFGGGGPKRPVPPQPMPRTCPRQGPSVRGVGVGVGQRSSPSCSDGSERSYPGHYLPQSPQSPAAYPPVDRGPHHPPLPRDYSASPVDYPHQHHPGAHPGANHNIPQKGFILPLSDRISPPQNNDYSDDDGDSVGGGEGDVLDGGANKPQPSPIDSISDASHMGRYSPSHHNSSPCSTGARSSPVSHDQYSRSHDDDSSDDIDLDLDEELPCINPYTIMDMERTGASSLQPYTVTDIPRLTDYPPSEQSS